MPDRYALSCPCSCHGRGSYAECDPAYMAGCGHLHTVRMPAQNGHRAPGRSCPGCGAGVADNALCGTCTERLCGDLGLVPLLARELEVIQAKQDRIGEKGPRGSSEVPLGFRPMASEIADVLHMTLAVWARHVAQAQGMPLLDVPAEHPVPLAVWLSYWREPIRHLPVAGQLVDEIGYAVKCARRAIDKPGDRIYAGPCDQCGEDLYAGHRSDTVKCKGCGALYPIKDRRVWLLKGLREHLATAAEISQGIGELNGQAINRKTINQWHRRDRLKERGRTRDGWPLFKIGDVLDLASKPAATRQQAG